MNELPNTKIAYINTNQKSSELLQDNLGHSEISIMSTHELECYIDGILRQCAKAENEIDNISTALPKVKDIKEYMRLKYKQYEHILKKLLTLYNDNKKLFHEKLYSKSSILFSIAEIYKWEYLDLYKAEEYYLQALEETRKYDDIEKHRDELFEEAERFTYWESKIRCSVIRKLIVIYYLSHKDRFNKSNEEIKKLIYEARNLSSTHDSKSYQYIIDAFELQERKRYTKSIPINKSALRTKLELVSEKNITLF